MAELTAVGYERLLQLLSNDEKTAGERFFMLRGKLLTFFEGRRLSPAEDLADEVFERVARIIERGEEIRDVNKYVFGVARFVALEAFQKTPSASKEEMIERRSKMPAGLTFDRQKETNECSDLMRSCMRNCLLQINEEKRTLLLNYYEIDESTGNHIKQRKKLASQHNKSIGALQKEICLLRQHLSRCAHDCIERESE